MTASSPEESVREEIGREEARVIALAGELARAQARLAALHTRHGALATDAAR